MTDSYTPSPAILEKYAQVLVHFALGQKEGIRKGEVVQCVVPDIAKPLALALHDEILKAGGHVMMRLLPTGFDRHYYQLANQEQLLFFPARYIRARVELIDHTIGIIADPDPEELKDVDPSKIMTARNASKKYREWLLNKESQGKLTWTLGLWGTQAKATIVGLSLEQYWQHIISACFLDKSDPIAHWRQIKSSQQQIRSKLNRLSIDWLHVVGPDADLQIQMGPNRIWMGGADNNIPSFELFTSPDWRGTEGWIRFNQPLYRYGNILEGVELVFKKGRVVQASAKKGETLLKEMLKSPNADKIGEFSLTDKRLSSITHFMAETLYDENMGGPHGNTHIAIGSAYRDCYRGDQSQVKKSEWKQMGFNDSPEHTDIISTTPRTVTATLTSGEQVLIYKDGQFQVWVSNN